jgi:hypothetical protein
MESSSMRRTLDVCRLACALLFCALPTATALDAAIPECPVDPYTSPTYEGGPIWGNSGSNPGSPYILPILHSDGITPMLPCETLQVNITISRPIPDPQWATVSATVRGRIALPANGAAFSKVMVPGTASGTANLPDIADGKGHPLPGSRGPSLLVTSIEIKADSNVKQQYGLYFSLSYTLTPRAGYNRGGWTRENATRLATQTTAAKLTLPQNSYSDKDQYYRVSVPHQGTISVSGDIENHFTSGNALFGVIVQNIDGSTAKTLVNNLSVGPVSTTSLPVPPNQVVFTNNSGQTKDYFVRFRSNGSSARISGSSLSIDTSIYSPTCSCQGAFSGGAGAGWTGNRTYRIADSFDSEHRADIKQAFDKWNAALLSASIGISFTLVADAADISVVKDDQMEDDAGWSEGAVNNDGRGTIGINSDVSVGILGLDPILSNLVEAVVMHEIGHVLEHSDVRNPPATGCTVRDTVLFEPIDPTGPFAGQVTCADTQAVAGSR